MIKDKKKEEIIASAVLPQNAKTKEKEWVRWVYITAGRGEVEVSSRS